MAQKNIITQTSLNDIKLVLNDTAANLTQHVNDSLSLAHGINLWPGFVDADGNDFTKFRNSNGDVVGNYIVTFYVNGVIYYAPANITNLQPQPPSSGTIRLASENVASVASGAWVTDFTSLALQAADATQTSVLLPHTRLGHWEAHGGMTVANRNTFDTNGNLVARFVVRFQFDGQIYEVPCETSITGVPQPVKSTLSINYLYFPSSAGSFTSQHPSGFPITATASGGTAPYTFGWYYREDIDPVTAGVLLPASATDFQDPGYNVKITFVTSTLSPFSTLTLTNIRNISGSNKNLFWYCKVTDAASATANSDLFRVQFAG
jgi:hypothetical protein